MSFKILMKGFLTKSFLTHQVLIASGRRKTVMRRFFVTLGNVTVVGGRDATVVRSHLFAFQRIVTFLFRLQSIVIRRKRFIVVIFVVVVVFRRPSGVVVVWRSDAALFETSSHWISSLKFLIDGTDRHCARRRALFSQWIRRLWSVGAAGTFSSQNFRRIVERRIDLSRHRKTLFVLKKSFFKIYFELFLDYPTASTRTSLLLSYNNAMLCMHRSCTFHI